MRSMESWASHFVVSPIHSPAQEIHCGIVLRHIHSDGWMLLLMFQTTEHHSVPSLWFTYKPTGFLWWRHFCYSHMLHRKRSACLQKSVFTVHSEYKLFFCPYSCSVMNHVARHIFFSYLVKVGIKSWSLTSGKHSLLPPSLLHTCRCTLVTQCFCNSLQWQRPSFPTQRQQNNRGARQQHSGCHRGHSHNATCIFVSSLILAMPDHLLGICRWQSVQWLISQTIASNAPALHFYF